MHMAFFQPCARDLHEAAIPPHLVDSGAAGVSHCGSKAADELVDNGPSRPLVRHMPFDNLRKQLVGGCVLLKIPIGRAARHGTQTSHTTVAFVAAPLVEDNLAWAFIGACNH